MAHIDVRDEGIELELEPERPWLVEGLPGVGLVGKIAADYLVDAFEMPYYATPRCDGLPKMMAYRDNHSELRPPVRLHADPDRNLVVLQSDAPISPTKATQFADCITSWLKETGVTPLYLNGIGRENLTDSRELYGVSTGAGIDLLDEEGIVPPDGSGVITGPNGALLHAADEVGIDSVGLIVETTPNFPDPEGARVLIDHGIAPITGVEVDTAPLVERVEEIRAAREGLAEQMHRAENEESSQARPLGMYQ